MQREREGERGRERERNGGRERESGGGGVAGGAGAPLPQSAFGSRRLQGYLDHKKQRPTGTLQ